MIAWRDLRGLRDPDRFDAWLPRLVVHVCIAQATRERRRTANLRVLPVDGPAAPDELPQRRRPGSARPRVPPASTRAAGDPRDAPLPGYAPTEIAETLGIPAGTARSRLHHAHRAMRAALEADARHGHGRTSGMNHTIERLLDPWFDEGPTEVPDRVLDGFADRIHRRRSDPPLAPPRRSFP